MSLLGLHYFLTVAEEMNISRAADKLFLRQQTLSSHIKRLEKQYGVTLFERRPYLHLTPSGEAMVFYAKQLLATERNMESHFADMDKASIGHLFLGMSRQRASAVFCDIWQQYHGRYPNIVVTLEEKNTEELLGLLRTHAVDMCVGVNVPPSKELQIEALLQEPCFCYLSDTLLQQYRSETWQQDRARYKEQGVDLNELRDMPFLIQPETNRIGLTLKRLFAAKEEPPFIQLETNNQEIIFRLSAEGASVLSPSFLYNWYHTSRAKTTDWPIYAITNKEFMMNVSFITLKGTHLPQYALDFKDTLFRCFEAYKLFIDGLLGKRLSYNENGAVKK